MASAYVLVQANPGAVAEVIAAMGELEQVEFVEAVTGPFDAVVAVGGSDDGVDEVRQRLVELGPVTRTLTCPAGSRA